MKLSLGDRILAGIYVLLTMALAVAAVLRSVGMDLVGDALSLIRNMTEYWYLIFYGLLAIILLLGVYMLNPLTPLIELFRAAYLGSQSYYLNYYWLSIAMTVLIFGLGVVLFSRVEKTFMDTV